MGSASASKVEATCCTRRRHRQESGGLTFILPLDQQFFFPSLTFAVKLDKILPLGNGKEWSRLSREKVKSLIEEAHSVELQVFLNLDA